jgi:uncharacterized membrane protein YhaH (DUF805 family)
MQGNVGCRAARRLANIAPPCRAHRLHAAHHTTSNTALRMHMSRELRPSGRIGRGGFWLRHATSVPLMLWLAIAAGRVPGPPYDLPAVALLVLMLVSIWGRRLHDRGRSAWWLLAAAVPLLGGLLLIVECGFRGSAAGASRFGPAPGERPDYLAVQPAPQESRA